METLFLILDASSSPLKDANSFLQRMVPLVVATADLFLRTHPLFGRLSLLVAHRGICDVQLKPSRPLKKQLTDALLKFLNDLQPSEDNVLSLSNVITTLLTLMSTKGLTQNSLWRIASVDSPLNDDFQTAAHTPTIHATAASNQTITTALLFSQSIHSCDAGDVLQAIQHCTHYGIAVHIASFSGAPWLFETLAKQTGGNLICPEPIDNPEAFQPQQCTGILSALRDVATRQRIAEGDRCEVSRTAESYQKRQERTNFSLGKDLDQMPEATVEMPTDTGTVEQPTASSVLQETRLNSLEPKNDGNVDTKTCRKRQRSTEWNSEGNHRSSNAMEVNKTWIDLLRSCQQKTRASTQQDVSEQNTNTSETAAAPSASLLASVPPPPPFLNSSIPMLLLTPREECSLFQSILKTPPSTKFACRLCRVPLALPATVGAFDDSSINTENLWPVSCPCCGFLMLTEQSLLEASHLYRNTSLHKGRRKRLQRDSLQSLPNNVLGSNTSPDDFVSIESTQFHQRAMPSIQPSSRVTHHPSLCSLCGLRDTSTTRLKEPLHSQRTINASEFSLVLQQCAHPIAEDSGDGLTSLNQQTICLDCLEWIEEETLKPFLE